MQTNPFEHGDEVTFENIEAVLFDDRTEPKLEELHGAYVVGQDIEHGTYVIVGDGETEVTAFVESSARYSADAQVSTSPHGLDYYYVEVRDGGFVRVIGGTFEADTTHTNIDLTDVSGALRVGDDIAA